jgi:hypothetical protein
MLILLINKYSFYINFTDTTFYPVGKIYRYSFKIVIYITLYSMPSTLKNRTESLKYLVFKYTFKIRVKSLKMLIFKMYLKNRANND